MSCRFVLKKLFTKEDPHFLHKTLGLLSVISFLYRYFVVYPMNGNLGLGNDWFSWATMLLHLGLSTSSLIFHVLARRIVHKPMIIWEEYRLHAIVFTLRCVSVFGFQFIVPASLKGTDAECFLLFMFITVHHLVVDRITQLYGTAGQTTVRVDNTGSKFLKTAKYYYGFYQFTALGSHLLPGANLHEMGFNTLIAIQSSAFLMTLFRKGLINWYSHALWYTACLMLSQYHMARHFDMIWLAKVCIAYFARTRFRMNKYLIWAVFCLVSSPGGHALLTQQTLSYAAYEQYATNAMDKGFWLAQTERLPSLTFGGNLDLPIFDFTLTWRVVTGFGLLLMGFERQMNVRENLPEINLPFKLPSLPDVPRIRDLSMPNMPAIMADWNPGNVAQYAFWGKGGAQPTTEAALRVDTNEHSKSQ